MAKLFLLPLVCLLFSLEVLATYNGLLERADEQFSKRDYTEQGVKNAEDAAANYEKVIENLLPTLDAHLGAARYLRANYFIASIKTSKAESLLFEGLAIGKRALLEIEKTYGRDMTKNNIPAAAKKIYSELVYYHALTVRSYIKAGGSASSEWKAAERLLNSLSAVGYDSIADFGPDQLRGIIQFEAGRFQEAKRIFSSIFAKTASNLHPSLSRIGLINYYYAQSLQRLGENSAAERILADFSSVDLFNLSLDWLPENRNFQNQSRANLHLLTLQSLEFARSRSRHSIATLPKQTQSQGRPLWRENEYVVKVAPFANLAWLQSSVFQAVTPIAENLYLLKHESSQNAVETFKHLMESPFIQIIEPNYLYYPDTVPDDPSFAMCWGLSNVGQLDGKGFKGIPGVDIKALEAWKITTGSSDVVVGVVDTGVDFSHPDLAANAWINQAEAQGQPGVDDDNNGYIDDIHGYDFLNNRAQIIDDHGHGTHVSGIIGARGQNGIGTAGVAWNVRIMGLKFLSKNGGGALADAIKAIQYGVKMGARILNNSWGTGQYSELLKQTIDQADQAGVLFVAAAGNRGRNADENPDYPAAYKVPSVVSVASIDNRGRLSKFSNYGNRSVHIAAPGENVFSTLPDNSYASWSGTSMAAPYVAGVASLVLSENPAMTSRDLKERLIKSASPLRFLTGKIHSQGIVNAWNALRNEISPPDPNDPARWMKKPAAIESGHPYNHSSEKIWNITVPGAKALSVHFSKIQLESAYDRIYLLDQNKSVMAVVTGTRPSEYSAIIEGDTVWLRLSTDATINDEGFIVDAIAYQ